MTNIIVSNNGKIRIIGSDSSRVNVSELTVYIPVELKYNHVNLLYVEGDTSDSCSLIQCENNGKYQTYKLNMYTPLNIQTGKGKIAVILIDTQKYTSFLSDFANINLSVDDYKKNRQSALIAELSDDIRNIYEKSLAMTKLNMELLEQIKKGGGEG